MDMVIFTGKESEKKDLYKYHNSKIEFKGRNASSKIKGLLIVYRDHIYLLSDSKYYDGGHDYVTSLYKYKYGWRLSSQITQINLIQNNEWWW